MEKNKKARQDYYHSNNDKYINEKKYESKEINVREYNPETDSYIITKKQINLELDWDNTEELYMNTLEIGEE